jgi:hypothetical protein
MGKSRTDCILGTACYHSVQKLLSSRLLSKNIKIKIYETIILPVILYVCETWWKDVLQIKAVFTLIKMCMNVFILYFGEMRLLQCCPEDCEQMRAVII